MRNLLALRKVTKMRLGRECNLRGNRIDQESPDAP